MTIFYFVPRHKLGEEIAIEFELKNPDLTAAVYRGVEQPDPLQQGKAMCHDMKLARAAFGAGQTLETACTVCQTKNICGYRKQKSIQADLWVLPNQRGCPV